MHQIIDIATNGRHLSRDRGFLKVSENGAEIGRTPLDQNAAVIVHAHGTTWSTSLLAELAERGAPVVLMCQQPSNQNQYFSPLRAIIIKAQGCARNGGLKVRLLNKHGKKL